MNMNQLTSLHHAINQMKNATYSFSDHRMYQQLTLKCATIKQILVGLILCLSCIQTTLAQTDWIESNRPKDNIEGNFSCAAAWPICGNSSQDFNFLLNKDTICDQSQALYYSFHFDDAVTNAIQIALSVDSANYEWYGPFIANNLELCLQINSYSANYTTGTFSATSPLSLSSTSEGIYILKIKNLPCKGSIRINTEKTKLTCSEKLPCQECVTSFSPTPGKYIVSAWVKEKVNNYTTTTYQNSFLEISFNGTTGSQNLYPSGQIIDGWQRIEQSIQIPANATGINISLKTIAHEAFFDDIRFFPVDGSMMSYVYDPSSLRLMAELDERNYATLYEYDEEGKLIRVKKETEKGIMTIQENRDNNSKQ
jgi:hypothetical protein